LGREKKEDRKKTPRKGLVRPKGGRVLAVKNGGVGEVLTAKGERNFPVGGGKERGGNPKRAGD